MPRHSRRLSIASGISRDVAPHRAAPAPVAAGLLAADTALFAQHDGMAFSAKEQRRADADDTAADDDHAGARRQTLGRSERYRRGETLERQTSAGISD